jgi:hypothetical protein
METHDQQGIDRSLIEAALRLTPTERLRQNDRMVNTIHALREAHQKAVRASNKATDRSASRASSERA